MKLVIGLGNYGEKYERTRHNVGFDVVDGLRRKLNLGEWNHEKKFKAEVIKGEEFILVRPLTYMNLSGQAVSLIAQYYKISPEDIIIIHDELDLPLGKIKVRFGGSAAGHHGVESVMNSLQTDKFLRIRGGIGNVKTQLAEHDVDKNIINDYVTGSFRSEEKAKVKHMYKQLEQVVETILKEGYEKAQNNFN